MSETALALPDEQQFKHDIQAINRFQNVVHANLIPNQDFGVIPGTQKPTLLKPGAEKIAKLLGLADVYEIIDKQEDWNKPFFRYLIKCALRSVSQCIVVSEGLGECNSMEAKYRWRETKRKCPACGAEAIIKGKDEFGGGWLCYKKQGGCGSKWPDGAQVIEEQKVGKVENDDIFSLVNTILKMAKKRALVDAALSAGRLSNVFTQDIEDMPDVVVSEKPPMIHEPMPDPKVPAEPVDTHRDLIDTLVRQCKVLVKERQVWNELELQNKFKSVGGQGSSTRTMLESLDNDSLLAFQGMVLEALAKGKQE